MKPIDYLCGMNFVSQYQRALQFRGSTHRVLINDIIRRGWNEPYNSFGPFGPTYSYEGGPDFEVWARRGEKFLRGDFSLNDF